MNLTDATKPQYGPKIDPLIYADNGPDTTQEWIDLAFAALDQARMTNSVVTALTAAIDRHAEREEMYQTGSRK